jgi:hypothetical protein
MSTVNDLVAQLVATDHQLADDILQALRAYTRAKTHVVAEVAAAKEPVDATGLLEHVRRLDVLVGKLEQQLAA